MCSLVTGVQTCALPIFYAGVVEQTLFPEEYVCVVPRTHLPNGRLTLNRFKAARHILADGRHLGHIHEDVEKLLRKIVGPQNITVMAERSEEHTSELQSLMRSWYAVFCLKKKKHNEKQLHPLQS